MFTVGSFLSAHPRDIRAVDRQNAPNSGVKGLEEGDEVALSRPPEVRFQGKSKKALADLQREHEKLKKKHKKAEEKMQKRDVSPVSSVASSNDGESVRSDKSKLFSKEWFSSKFSRTKSASSSSKRRAASPSSITTDMLASRSDYTLKGLWNRLYKAAARRGLSLGVSEEMRGRTPDRKITQWVLEDLLKKAGGPYIRSRSHSPINNDYTLADKVRKLEREVEELFAEQQLGAKMDQQDRREERRNLRRKVWVTFAKLGAAALAFAGGVTVCVVFPPALAAIIPGSLTIGGAAMSFAQTLRTEITTLVENPLFMEDTKRNLRQAARDLKAKLPKLSGKTDDASKQSDEAIEKVHKTLGRFEQDVDLAETPEDCFKAVQTLEDQISRDSITQQVTDEEQKEELQGLRKFSKGYRTAVRDLILSDKSEADVKKFDQKLERLTADLPKTPRLQILAENLVEEHKKQDQQVAKIETQANDISSEEVRNQLAAIKKQTETLFESWSKPKDKLEDALEDWNPVPYKAIVEKLRKLHTNSGQDPSVRKELTKRLYDWAGLDRSPAAYKVAVEELWKLHNNFGQEAIVREVLGQTLSGWARSSRSLYKSPELDKSSGITFKAVIQELRKLHNNYGRELVIRELLAATLRDWSEEEKSPTIWKTAVKELRKLHNTYGREPVVREVLSDTLYDWSRAEKNPKNIVDEIQKLHDNHGQESSIRTRLVLALLDWSRIEENPATCKTIVEKLRNLHSNHNQESSVRNHLVSALYNWHTVETNPQIKKNIKEELTALYENHGQEHEVKEWLDKLE